MSLLRARLHERTVAPARARVDGTASLADLPTGATAIILGFVPEAPAEVVRRLFDLGLAPGAEIGSLRKAPMSDPLIFTVAGYEIALRSEQARLIDVSAAA